MPDTHQQSAPIEMGRNHPPHVPGVFDPAFRRALEEALAIESPTTMVGAHRWMGTQRDREAGAVFAARRLGAVPATGRVVVTNGTQSALMMLFAGLVGQGGTLVAEALSYPVIRIMAARLGARVVGVAMDDDGLLPDAFDAACRRDRPGALYTMPTLQNPTTAVMSHARRQAIVAVARAHGVPIIEDDIYSLLPQDAPPPLAALAPELGWHVQGVAKSIAAGMKIAYVTAPSESEAGRLFWPGVRATWWMATPVSAAVMARLTGNGDADRIIDATRVETAQRQALVRQVFGNMPHATRADALHVWIPLPPDRPRDAVAARCRAAGVSIGTSDQYVMSGDAPEAVRIGIGNTDDHAALGRALHVVRDAITA